MSTSSGMYAALTNDGSFVKEEGDGDAIGISDDEGVEAGAKKRRKRDSREEKDVKEKEKEG
jgi:hypothetical protein